MRVKFEAGILVLIAENFDEQTLLSAWWMHEVPKPKYVSIRLDIKKETDNESKDR